MTDRKPVLRGKENSWRSKARFVARNQQSNAEIARRFYSQLFGWQMTQTNMGGMQYTMLKHEGEDFGGIVPTIGPNWRAFHH